MSKPRQQKPLQCTKEYDAASFVNATSALTFNLKSNKVEKGGSLNVPKVNGYPNENYELELLTCPFKIN